MLAKDRIGIWISQIQKFHIYLFKFEFDLFGVVS